MTVLVTGITGYVGSVLAARLAREGHAVRGFARSPERVAIDVPVVAGDAVSGAGLAQALDGVDVAYFLIHAMEPAQDGPFATREHDGQNVRRRATRDGYLCVLVYTDRHWRAFLTEIGKPDLFDTDPRFATLGKRTENIGALYAMVADAMKTRSSLRSMVSRRR